MLAWQIFASEALISMTAENVHVLVGTLQPTLLLSCCSIVFRAHLERGEAALGRGFGGIREWHVECNWLCNQFTVRGYSGSQSGRLSPGEVYTTNRMWDKCQSPPKYTVQTENISLIFVWLLPLLLVHWSSVYPWMNGRLVNVNQLYPPLVSLSLCWRMVQWAPEVRPLGVRLFASPTILNCNPNPWVRPRGSQVQPNSPLFSYRSAPSLFIQLDFKVIFFI
jgi:hypothetical protein